MTSGSCCVVFRPHTARWQCCVHVYVFLNHTYSMAIHHNILKCNVSYHITRSLQKHGPNKVLHCHKVLGMGGVTPQTHVHVQSPVCA